jgi:hypothetical protein
MLRAAEEVFPYKNSEAGSWLQIVSTRGGAGVGSGVAVGTGVWSAFGIAGKVLVGLVSDWIRQAVKVQAMIDRMNTVKVFFIKLSRPDSY